MSGGRSIGPRVWRVAAAPVVAAVIAGAVWMGSGSGLEVRVVAVASGRVLWRGPIGSDGGIELRYLHSVEQTPVIERFRAAPDGLWFMEMRFVSQGAGLPTEGYVREGDWFVLRRERRLGSLPLRVASAPGHRLRVGDVELDLTALAGDGVAIEVTSSAARRWRWPQTR